jgi:hypothetical protein
MTSSHHGPYGLGVRRATMVSTEGCQIARWSQSLKRYLSSDCRLQLDGMKLESLVIADQPCRGEYSSRVLYTPPVKPWEMGIP